MPHARCQAIFSYLYHEFIPVMAPAFIQGEGCCNGGPPARPHYLLRVRLLANSLTRGMMPAPYVPYDVTTSPQDDWQRNISEAFFSYTQPLAPFAAFLATGITCRPPVVQCGKVATWFNRKPGPSGRVDLELDAVVAGAFMLTTGEWASVIVSASNLPQKAVVSLSQVVAEEMWLRGRMGQGMNGATSLATTLYSGNGTEVRRWDGVPKEVVLTLNGYGVQVLVVRNASVNKV